MEKELEKRLDFLQWRLQRCLDGDDWRVLDQYGRALIYVDEPEELFQYVPAISTVEAVAKTLRFLNSRARERCTGPETIWWKELSPEKREKWRGQARQVMGTMMGEMTGAKYNEEH